MPIIVKDFQWMQTEKTVTIKIPLKGIRQSKADLFTSPKYIKASYERFFFEAFLLYPIDTNRSKCTLTNSDIIFELVKVEEQLWDNLEADIPKLEKLELKKQIIEEEHSKFQEACKEKQNRKSELKKVAVREQIAFDTKQRELIETIKREEKENALGNISNWQLEHSKPKIIELSDDDEEEFEEPCRKPIKPVSKVKKENIIPIPLPRAKTTIEVSFTPREFPTPSRESRLEEENEWLRKQAIARRSAGFVSEDLRPEEKNPQYLKCKGDEFLKTGNYLAAISAYSFGIKLSDKFVDLYIKRSEAHLAIGNFHKTIQDCTRALELMKPEVPSNLKERFECIERRGTALCKIGMLKEGISELEIALKMQPTNEGIKEKLQQAKIDFNKEENET